MFLGGVNMEEREEVRQCNLFKRFDGAVAQARLAST